MFPQVDTKSAPAVAAVVRATFLHAHPGADTTVIDALFRDVEDMFHGRYLDYLLWTHAWQTDPCLCKQTHLLRNLLCR